MECPIYIKSNLSKVSFKACVSLLISVQTICPLIKGEYYKSPLTWILRLSFSPLWLLVFTWHIEGLLCWMCISLLYLLLGLNLWSLGSGLLCLLKHSLFQSLFCLIWILLFQLSYDFHLHGIPSPIPLLSVCKCPEVWSESLVDNIYMGLVFVSTQPVCVFWLVCLIHLHLG